jgi:2-hydroxy-6-oxonona-2,4-dienedioate hydrolase
MIRAPQHLDWPSPQGPVPFVSMGHGDRVVVLLHGLFGSPDNWYHVMADLADDYRVIAPQLPVDRQPDRRQRGINTMEELTDHIADFLFGLGLPPFVICGNSLGGLVSMEICLRYPERVCGLVLAGSAGLYERNLTHGVRPKPSYEFVRAVAADIFHDPRMITNELVEEWYQSFQDRDFVRFLLRVSRATRDRTIGDELNQLKLPTLIVWGRNDKVTPPEVAETFKCQIGTGNADLRFIDNCGHAPNLEQPALFSATLRKFLPGCFPRRLEYDGGTLVGLGRFPTVTSHSRKL